MHICFDLQVPTVTTAVPGRAMRRVSSVPSRSHSPAYASGVSPSRGSLRTSAGSSYGSPIVTEPKPLSSIYSTTLPTAQRSSTSGGGGTGSPYSTLKNSPAALRRMGSTNSRSGSASRTTSPYQASAGSSSGRMGSPLTMVDNMNSPLTKQPTHSSSPVRASMTAVPQHYSSTLPRSLIHNTDPYGPQSYDIYERMTRPDSLTGACTYTDTNTHTQSYLECFIKIGKGQRVDTEISSVKLETITVVLFICVWMYD